MLNFVLRRLLWIVPVVVVVSAATFFLMHQAPGGPWDQDKPLPPQAEASLNKKFGLDKPQWINYDNFSTQLNDGERNPLTLTGAFLIFGR